MTSQKRNHGKNPVEPNPSWAASRPYTPGPDYGIPTGSEGLLPWQYVTDRMASAKCYWITTVSPNGRPHATPVDGVWLDDHLYFGGSPATRRSRNLVDNPAVCIHLESGTESVILHGDALALTAVEHTLAVRLAEASKQKYGYSQRPEEYEANPGNIFAFHPQVVFAWNQFPKDVTRFTRI
ncbi:MAG: pyridoxamine 5'-phosphate oxidase family protein [Anaerolineaceae bacterium]|nr:pyridoxamine 5'-phosphate oxidase family protein [Anaerolineaceae bacterium]